MGEKEQGGLLKIALIVGLVAIIALVAIGASALWVSRFHTQSNRVLTTMDSGTTQMTK